MKITTDTPEIAIPTLPTSALPTSALPASALPTSALPAPNPPESSAPTTLGALTRFRRPRLLPGLQVLHRGRGEVQVGTDPRHAVVLSEVPEPLWRVLHTLDGRDTVAELTARAGPVEPSTLDHVLTSLADLGLLEDAAPADTTKGPTVPARLAADCSWWALRTAQERVNANVRRMQAAVVIHGGGRVAVSVATLLAAAGVGWVSTVTDGLVQPEETGCGYLEEDVGRRRSVAIRKAIVRTAPATNTSPLPRSRTADLVLLADAAVPDPHLAGQLFAEGVPQLVVWASEGIGVVGPLVVPGRTCCLNCVDLHKTATEPAWPALATQLAGKPQQADLASAQASAAFAVSQALRVLDGPGRDADGGIVDPSEAPVWGTAVEIDTYTSETRSTSWKKHPFCACGKEGGR